MVCGVWVVAAVCVQEEEQKRIVGAGGFVAMNRVNGSLAVSRALGDYDFKRHPTLAPAQQQVSAEPTLSGTGASNAVTGVPPCKCAVMLRSQLVS